MKKITKQLEHIVIDEEGVLLSQTTHKEFYVNNEPDYIKLYIKDLVKIHGLPTSINGVLFSLLQRMGYTNDISINAPLKRAIALEVNITEHGIKKAIEHLVKTGILIRKDRGFYMFNPYLFGRGKWNEIKAIRMTIDYNSLGRTENLQIAYTELEQQKLLT